MEPVGVFILGAFLFACILVAEHRRGGEPPGERSYRLRDQRRDHPQLYRMQRGERWRAWIHGGKGREQNNTVVGTAWIGFIIMCLYAWMALNSPGRCAADEFAHRTQVAGRAPP